MVVFSQFPTATHGVDAPGFVYGAASVALSVLPRRMFADTAVTSAVSASRSCLRRVRRSGPLKFVTAVGVTTAHDTGLKPQEETSADDFSTAAGGPEADRT